jgi:hypothetical protein
MSDIVLCRVTTHFEQVFFFRVNSGIYSGELIFLIKQFHLFISGISMSCKYR